MGAGAQALGGLQPTSRRAPPPTFGVCCWRAPGTPGPGSGQLPFGSEAARGKGLLGGGQDGQALLGPTQSCAWGVDQVLCGPVCTTPWVSSEYSWSLRLPDPRHTRTQLPPPQLALGGGSAQVFTPEPAPRLRLSSQQTSSAAGPPDALRLPLCPQRPETLPHPLTPWGPPAPSPAPAWFSRPFGVCPCPAPPPNSGYHLVPPPASAQSSSLNTCVPRRLQPTKPETPPSPSMSPRPSFKQGSDPGDLR